MKAAMSSSGQSSMIWSRARTTRSRSWSRSSAPLAVMRNLRAMPPSGSAMRSASPARVAAAVWRLRVEASSPKASLSSPLDMGPWIRMRLSRM